MFNFLRKLFCSNPTAPAPKPAAAAPGNRFAAAMELSQSSVMQVCDPQGTPMDLGESLFQGGEGSIYQLSSYDNLLVKVYHDMILQNPTIILETATKLASMEQLWRGQEPSFLAWPIMSVYGTGRYSGQVVGFVMRKKTGHSLRVLSGPQNVQRYFPAWNRLNLIQAAIQFAKNLDRLHKKNILLNDFNPANIFVDASGNVSFIDCDSYQFSVRGQQKIYHSGVHFATHGAPELLLQPEYLKQPRTVKQDRFGAAIILYQILMLGMHPYSHIGGSDPETNLRMGLCPLGSDAKCKLPEGIWYNLWSWLSYDVKHCFIQTFKNGHKNPEKRTSMYEWVRVLKLYQKQAENFGYDVSLTPPVPKPQEYKGHRSDL